MAASIWSRKSVVELISVSPAVPSGAHCGMLGRVWEGAEVLSPGRAEG